MDPRTTRQHASSDNRSACAVDRHRHHNDVVATLARRRCIKHTWHVPRGLFAQALTEEERESHANACPRVLCPSCVSGKEKSHARVSEGALPQHDPKQKGPVIRV